MKVEIEKVFERDIDLLMMNKFLNYDSLSQYFCSKIGLDGYKVKEVQHSVSDENGESDITVILDNGSEKVAFLIEDKIDAIAMPNQRDRYNLRGESGVKNNIYDRFFVFMIAPKDYLDSNLEAKKYENQITYEELIDMLGDDIYAKALLEKALEEKKKGYIIIENESVTKFWADYYKYIDDNYSMLNVNKVDGPRGASAVWPTFNTPFKQYKIRHKSDRGNMDLEFPKLADKYFDFMNQVKDILDSDMSVQVTGKSLSIRLKVPIIDFKQNFNDYCNEMKISMDAVVRLQNLLSKIDLNKLPKE